MNTNTIKNLKVNINFTVEVDQKAYADYYGISPTDYGCKSLADAVRHDLRLLLGDATNMAPHLFDEGIIQ